MRLPFSRQIIDKSTNKNINGNVFNRRRVVPCRWTDGHTHTHTQRQTYRHDVVNSSLLQFCEKHLKNDIISDGVTSNSEPSVHKEALTSKPQNPMKCLRLGRYTISSIFPFAKYCNEIYRCKEKCVWFVVLDERNNGIRPKKGEKESWPKDSSLIAFQLFHLHNGVTMEIEW
jgi:hypothetical protein